MGWPEGGLCGIKSAPSAHLTEPLPQGQLWANKACAGIPQSAPFTPHFPNHLNINPNQKRIFTFSLVLSKKFRNLQFFKILI